MAGAGVGADPAPPGPEAPGAPEGAALEARLATLEAALAGEAAELEAERAALALAERSVRAREASVEEMEKDVAEARRVLDLHRKGQAARQDPNWRDWAGGLPEELLAKIALAHVAQTGAGWAAFLKQELGWRDKKIQEEMAKRKRDGNCLFVIARVCRRWRKAQLKVGGRLRTQVQSDVILPGSVALAKWALVEGCPRERGDGVTMAWFAARYGQVELVKWLCGEGGFAMDVELMKVAASGGNLELVQWLRGEGCPWDHWTCYWAVNHGHVEVLRWSARTAARGTPSPGTRWPQSSGTRTTSATWLTTLATPSRLMTSRRPETVRKVSFAPDCSPEFI